MVEIRIDTKRDSDEEIRKAIRYLQSVIGESYSTNSYGSDDSPAPEPAGGAFNMFGSDDDAPSDLNARDEEVETSDDAVIEIVEY